MINPPSEKFPYAPIMKRVCTWSFLNDYATVLDGQLLDICNRAAAQPFSIDAQVATGSMQSIAIPASANLTKPPSLVKVLVTQTPAIKTEGVGWTCPYKIEYGAHTKDTIFVKIEVDTKDGEVTRQLGFDVLVFP